MDTIETATETAEEPYNLEAENALSDFIKHELPGKMARFQDLSAEICVWAYFIWCDLKTGKEFNRRLLVLSDAGSRQVRVCIEASYQTFECDTCFHVERVGTIDRGEVENELQPLLHKAYARMLTWQPTPENIWDYVA